MFHNRDYIFAVYKNRSFGKAAEELHISQPSLSAAVAKEEKLLGMQIFNRKTSPISLTPFGQEYIRAVENIHEMEEHLQTLSYEDHALQSGSISIAASNLGIPHVIPRVIAEFKKTYPLVDIRIIETSTSGAKQMLDSGELDLFVTNRPLDPEKYTRIVCDRECLIWVVPREFGVNRELKDFRLRPEELGDAIFSIPEERAVPAKVFEDVPFILLHDTNYLRLCVNIIFQESGVVPKVVMEFEHSASSYNFASFGIGATVFSNRLVEDRVDIQNLYFYKIRSRYSCRDTFLCYRKGRYVTAAMQKAIELIVTRMREGTGGA
ncbi:LysR family transcriptional regulator [Dysosmobacter sp.]|uniref:LysR family transcriptional regulator n=1 Tax=Dysosmobacter sp. TaxID=2591382 RepID=UPI002A8AEB4A|nr:LysR family transcriptional regulator [Dysosmobacter sp.]MDY3282480.1 LysR family transcriptional regulator [Dysosmobacter sp.]